MLRQTLAALLLALLVMPLQAQERLRPSRGAGLWVGFGVKGRAPKSFENILGENAYKRLRLAGETGYRTADELASGPRVFFDASASYKVNKFLDVGLEQRIAFRADSPNRHRTGIKVMLGHSVDRFELKYRFSYQHNYREWGEVREVLRNRFEVGYNIPKFKYDPTFSVEFFTWAGYRGWNYIGTRYQLGTEREFRDGHTIGAAVIHDRERSVAYPRYRTILSLDYSINLSKL